MDNQTQTTASDQYKDGESYWVKTRGNRLAVLQRFNGLWFQFGSDEPETVLKVYNKVNEPVLKKAARQRKRSRIDRWTDAASTAAEALEALEEVQQEYQDWLDNLPDNLRYSSLGEKLEAICGIDISSAKDAAEEAVDADMPLGFGRD